MVIWVDIATTVIIGFLVIVFVAIILSGVKILREWERAPVLMLGRFRGLLIPTSILTAGMSSAILNQ
ncbi:MAG: hypothetical protein M1368_11945 [Thaumarchaeota archaeon]|nr:hypothetical protein [Nitrososphaerota archaeon]